MSKTKHRASKEIREIWTERRILRLSEKWLEALGRKKQFILPSKKEKRKHTWTREFESKLRAKRLAKVKEREQQRAKL